jgi:hypothetical protein
MSPGGIFDSLKEKSLFFSPEEGIVKFGKVDT